MTVGAYTTDAEVEQSVQEACLEEAAQLSLNLTGGVYVQTAAFSDFHGSGGNPAANAALCDGAFVANRFRVVEVRRRGLGVSFGSCRGRGAWHAHLTPLGSVARHRCLESA